MKKILFLLCFMWLMSCQNEEPLTQELLAQRAFSALQNNDLELFNSSFVDYEWYIQYEDMTKEEYENLVTKLFVQSQEEFSERGYKAADFEIFKINSPYREYYHSYDPLKKDSLKHARYQVVINNKQNNFLTLEISDCAEIDKEWKLGQAIKIVDN